MIEIKKLDGKNAADANLPNEPFQVWGRIVPALRGGEWTYQIREYDAVTQMSFPDFPYDPGKDDAVFFGAYEGDKIVGLAVVREGPFGYLYLHDLKVMSACRRMGVGGQLIDACMEEAKAQQKQGVYTIGQDNNLSACLFYLDHGFEIGGFDNRAYRGTPQEDKADVFFYRDC